MTKLDEFVATMQKAFILARELGPDGISSIHWSLDYYGTPEATQEIQERIYNAMENAGMTINKGAA